jgi:hypothetical protein
MYKNSFKNELTNKITIKIKKTKDTFTDKTGETHKFNAVSVQLIGPTSMSENIITYKEAEELYTGLATFLNK